MRKLGIIGIILLIIGIVYVNLRAIDEQPSSKVLIQQTLYSITTDESMIQVPFYLNKNSAITKTDAISTIYLHTQDESLKLKADILDVQKGGQKKYLNETYQTYYFKLSLPKLDMDLYMKECLLTITLKNDERHTFSIGRLSIFRVEADDVIDILTQHGKNSDMDHRLSELTLDIKTTKPVTIKTVFYTANHRVEVDREIINRQELVINIPLDAFLYKETALKIAYEIDGVLYEKTFGVFRYFDRVTRTLDDEHINRVYVLN